jgi:hypothetical protein
MDAGDDHPVPHFTFPAIGDPPEGSKPAVDPVSDGFERSTMTFPYFRLKMS